MPLLPSGTPSVSAVRAGVRRGRDR